MQVWSILFLALAADAGRTSLGVVKQPTCATHPNVYTQVSYDDCNQWLQSLRQRQGKIAFVRKGWQSDNRGDDTTTYLATPFHLSSPRGYCKLSVDFAHPLAQSNGGITSKIQFSTWSAVFGATYYVFDECSKARDLESLVQGKGSNLLPDSPGSSPQSDRIAAGRDPLSRKLVFPEGRFDFEGNGVLQVRLLPGSIYNWEEGYNRASRDKGHISPFRQPGQRACYPSDPRAGPDCEAETYIR